MNHGWKYITSEECFSSITPKCKIEKKNYSNGNLIPIISQEEDFISGYWDNHEDTTPHARPIVVFGDHSRVLKYIDFDFVVGADGVKILLPYETIDAKFLYYFLKWKNIPSLGYSRHFRLLKEFKYPCPQLQDQNSIISELDKINELIEVKRSQLADLDLLAQSLFYEMFGDPITNPKGWEIRPLKDAVKEMFLGPFGSSLKTDCYVPEEDSYAMVYEQKHAIKASLNQDNHFISEDKFNALKRFEVQPGDFIMSCRGTIGKLYCVPINAPKGIIHPSLMKIRIDDTCYSHKFFSFFLPLIIKNENTKGNCVQMAITAKELGDKLLPMPPLSFQNQFADKIKKIEEQKKRIESSLTDLQTLLASRMDYWFND